MVTASSRSVAVCLLAGLLAASPALADDISPPAWRGQSGTTFAQWEFSTSGTYVGDPVYGYTYSADTEANPYGPSFTVVWPASGQVWQAEWGQRQGVWPLSGALDITIPNNPVDNPYKDIWIQVTWAAQSPGSEPHVAQVLDVIDDDYILFPATLFSQTQLEPTGLGEYWYLSIYTLHLEPNPSEETIHIAGVVMLDEVVIDTIGVPEPASLALVAACGLALLRRRTALG